jgi:hypothetical protein
MRTGGYVVGYHGTTRKIADRIVAEKRFLITDRSHHWLGPGAYFFIDAPLRAYMWAVDAVGKEGNDEPAVLMAKIYLEDVLDLLDGSVWQLLKAEHRRYCSAYENNGRCAPHQKRPVVARHDGKRFHFFRNSPTTGRPGNNFVDSEIVKLAITRFRGHGREVRSVRAAFIEGQEVYPGSYFYDKYHVQLAILEDSSSAERRAIHFDHEESMLEDVSIVKSDKFAEFLNFDGAPRKGM